jgi:hypothetical protein
MTVRAVWVIVVVWLLCSLALWVRDGRSFSILETLPFVQRSAPLSSTYEWLALAILAAGLWSGLMLTRERPVSTNPVRNKPPVLILVLLPATIVGLALLTARITPAVRFADVVGHRGDLLAHQYLTVLALLVIGVLLAIKWLRSP